MIQRSAKDSSPYEVITRPQTEVPDLVILDHWTPHRPPKFHGVNLDDAPIFSARYLNQLARGNPRVPATLQTLAAAGRDEILAIPGFGEKVWASCAQVLQWAQENASVLSEATRSSVSVASTATHLSLSELIADVEGSLTTPQLKLLKVLYYSEEPMTLREVGEQAIVTSRPVSRQQIKNRDEQLRGELKRIMASVGALRLRRTASQLLELIPEWRLMTGLIQDLNLKPPSWWDIVSDTAQAQDILRRVLRLLELGTTTDIVLARRPDGQWVAYRPSLVPDNLGPFHDLAAETRDGVIACEVVHERLRRARLTPDEIDYLVAAWDYRSFGGCYVRASLNMGDQLAAYLELIGEPTGVSEVCDLLVKANGDRPSERYLKNIISDDERFHMLQGGQSIALVGWGLAGHTTLADALDLIFKENGNPLSKDFICDILSSSRFRFARSSIKTYLSAPRFLTESGRIFLLPDNRLPTIAPRSRSSKEFRVLSENKLLVFIAVNQDVLRGSGAQISRDLGCWLGAQPGKTVTFRQRNNRLMFYWDPKSPQPQRSSIRKALEDAGLNTLGTKIQILLDLTSQKFHLTEVPKTPLSKV